MRLHTILQTAGAALVLGGLIAYWSRAYVFVFLSGIPGFYLLFAGTLLRLNRPKWMGDFTEHA